jgi:peptidoglycan/LPS O-acetylase OafA/YrhL
VRQQVGNGSLLVRLREDATHLSVLTGIRGWAALWVLLYHTWVYAGAAPLLFEIGGIDLNLTPLLSMGGAGVSIFFVLSGFLLSLPFAAWQAGLRQRPATGAYFLRRVLRVFPAYYAQLAVLLVIAHYVPGGAQQLDAAGIVRHLLMLFTPPPLGMQPLNGVWWTLPIEFSFYLILPFVAFLLRPKRGVWLLAASLATMGVWRHYAVVWLADASIPERVVASYQLPGSMDMFGAGMLAALLHVNREKMPASLRPPEGSGSAAALGLALVVAAIYWLYAGRGSYWADNPIFYLWTPALSLGIVAIVLAGTGGSPLVRTLFGNRFMVFAGIVSYSIYLWHLPILSWVSASEFFQAIKDARLPALLAIGLPATFLVATVSYLLVERPFMQMRLRVRG